MNNGCSEGANINGYELHIMGSNKQANFFGRLGSVIVGDKLTLVTLIFALLCRVVCLCSININITYTALVKHLTTVSTLEKKFYLQPTKNRPYAKITKDLSNIRIHTILRYIQLHTYIEILPSISNGSNLSQHDCEGTKVWDKIA